MKKTIFTTTAITLCILALGLGTTSAISATSSGPRVDNFELTDQTLLAHNLYSMGKDSKAVVLITQGVGCPVVRNNATAYNALQKAYAGKGVEFFMINSNIQDSREDIAKEAAEFHYNMPVLQDTYQLVGEQLGLKRTAEVIIIDPKTWKVVFRGPVDDRVTYERQKASATKNYAKDALDSFLASKPVAVSQVESPGCLINLVATTSTPAPKISYVKDIAPIIQDKCITCHQSGGIGPMTLVSYEDVKGHSPMIREVIRTKRMPPWHADPRIGHFSNDRSLSAEQTKTLVHWIESGSPRGEGADPLGTKKFAALEWPLGTPDVILNIPQYTIPATGVVDYQNPWAAIPAGFEDRWLRSSTIKVDQRQAVHHVLTGYLPKVPASGDVTRGGGIGGPSVGGYAVGAESNIWPKDSGTYIAGGGAVGFQLHYTPYGKEVTDKTRIGLYFYPKGEVPTYVLHNSVIVDSFIQVAPNDHNWADVAYITFPADAKLFNVFPHTHYRGRSASVELQYPDGHKELIFSMPHYDFNWQGSYNFAKPLDIPAGTKMIAHFTYDNSVRNPYNPDPNRTVPWGDQSFDEMFYMAFDYQWKEETSSHRTPQYETALQTSRIIGMIDKNIDGKIQASELTAKQFSAVLKNFSMLDRNGDGALDSTELASVPGLGGFGGRPPRG
jgi:hypothetical protein